MLLKNGFDEKIIDDSMAKLGLSEESSQKSDKKEAGSEKAQESKEPKTKAADPEKKETTPVPAKKHALGMVLISLLSFILITALNLAVSAASLFVAPGNSYSLYLLVIGISFLIGAPTAFILKMLTKSFKRTAAFSLGISILSSMAVFSLTTMQIQKMSSSMPIGLFEPAQSFIPSFLIVAGITVLFFNISLLFVLDRKKR